MEKQQLTPQTDFENTQNQKEIALVSVSGSTKDGPAKPEEVSDSALFKEKLEYAQRAHEEVYILTPEHGLVDLDNGEIETAGETLIHSNTTRRRTWALEAFKQLVDKDLLGHKIKFHAEQPYYQELTPFLEQAGADYEIMAEEVTNSGEKISWYKERNTEAAANSLLPEEEVLVEGPTHRMGKERKELANISNGDFTLEVKTKVTKIDGYRYMVFQIEPEDETGRVLRFPLKAFEASNKAIVKKLKEENEYPRYPGEKP